MAIAGFNYLYYPILGHVMDVQHFGELQLLLTFVNQTAVIILAFNVVAIVYAASNSEDINILTEHLQRLAFVVMALFLVVAVIGAPVLAHLFKFGSAWPFVLLGATFVISVPLTFCTAYLQGKKHFGKASVAGALQAFLKILFSLVLVMLGWKALGAMAGIVLAQMFSLWYVWRAAHRVGYSGKEWQFYALPAWNVISPQMLFILTAAITSVITNILYTGDIVAIKRYFSPEIAGQYAGIATIARIIFFATVSISGVLIASVHMAAEPKENRHTLYRSLLLVGVIGAALLLVFSAFPRQIIAVLVGNRYEPMAYALPLISTVTFLVSIINLLFYYHLALRRLVILPVSLVGGVGTILLVFVRHGSVTHILQAFLAGSTLTLLLLLIIGVYYGRSSRPVETTTQLDKAPLV
jgi:O-antigen/teichoic acid export membrane protein